VFGRNARNVSINIEDILVYYPAGMSHKLKKVSGVAVGNIFAKSDATVNSLSDQPFSHSLSGLLRP